MGGPTLKMLADRQKGYLEVGIAAVLWGSIGIFSKLLIANRVFPIEQLFFRAVFGLLYVLTFLFLTRNLDFLKINGHTLVRYLPLALTNILFMGLTLISVFYTSVSHAFVIIGTYPLLVVFLSPILLKEKINIFKVTAAVIAVCGIAVIMGIQSEGSSLFGDFLAFLTAVVGALYVIVSKKCRDLYDTWELIPWIYFFVILLTIPFFLGMRFIAPELAVITTNFNASILLLLASFALFATTIPHVIYLVGIKYIYASTASLLMSLEPVSAVIFAVVFIGEALTINVIVGGALVVFSICLNSRFLEA